MSKKINKSSLAEDTAKRFRMLCEYSFYMNEDEGEDAPEEQNQETGENGGIDEPDMGQNTPDMSGNEPDMSGNEPDMGQSTPDMSGNEPDMGGANMPDMEQNSQDGVNGFNPTPEGSEFDGNEIEGIEDDEVIDVDDLTQSQEDTEDKVDDIHVTMEKGFEKLLKVVGKLDKMIDASTESMENIKREIEKRNPTPVEKLNMRAANDSYPFNVSPNDYWKQKEATSNYRIGGENEPDAKQYIITQGDIDDITDFRRISKEIDDSEISQNLMNIFGLR